MYPGYQDLICLDTIRVEGISVISWWPFNLDLSFHVVPVYKVHEMVPFDLGIHIFSKPVIFFYLKDKGKLKLPLILKHEGQI